MANQTAPQRPRKGKDAPRPDWVDVAGRVWDIEWSKTSDDFRDLLKRINFPGDPEDVAAVTDHHKMTIIVNTEVHLNIQRENLLHELMHAVLFGVKADNGDDSKVIDIDWEEHYLSAMDAPLLATLKRNPHVTAWLLAG